jgi:replicative DNA helicase
MKLSTPVYRLKRLARIISRNEGIPLHEALDRVALQEGFRGWSHLSQQLGIAAPAAKLFAQLQPGNLLLVAARPSQGKTLLALEIAVEASRGGHLSMFFSLEATENDCESLLRSIGVDPGSLGERFAFDGTDSICADYVITQVAEAPRGTLVVIDYLQLLDQRRDTAPLDDQVRSLKALAVERGLIVVFISQIHRSFDPKTKSVPDIEDIRLPNPVDLTLFDRACFLHDGELRFT